MTIDPYLQCARLLAALFCGLALGLLADVVKQLFVLFGVCQPQASLAALYKRPLPLVNRPVCAPKNADKPTRSVPDPSHTAKGASTAQGTRNTQSTPSTQGANAPSALHVTPAARAARAVCAVGILARRAVQVLLLVLAEFLFPVLAALLLLLVSFYYERGAFRLASVPILLSGLLLWRGKLSRGISRPLSLTVFLLAAAGVYLRAALALPVKVAFWLLGRFCLSPLKHALEKICLFYQKKRSARLSARQLEAAKNGFLNVKEKRKENVEKKQKGARQRLRPHARHPRADRADLHRGADHRL